MGDRLHMRGLPDDSVCDVHEWGTNGMARRLIEAMRERHGKGGVNVCRDCLERARDDAKVRAEKQQAEKARKGG